MNHMEVRMYTGCEELYLGSIKADDEGLYALSAMLSAQAAEMTEDPALKRGRYRWASICARKAGDVEGAARLLALAQEPPCPTP